MHKKTAVYGSAIITSGYVYAPYVPLTVVYARPYLTLEELKELLEGTDDGIFMDLYH